MGKKTMKKYFKNIQEYGEFIFSDINSPEHGCVFDEQGYMINWSEMRYRSRLFILLFEFFVWIFKYTICFTKGHSFKDNSYGGPESGCIDLECTRCGYGFHQTLY